MAATEAGRQAEDMPEVQEPVLGPREGEERNNNAMKYEVRMEGASETIDSDSLADAINQAKDWMRNGSWDTSNGTIWVHGILAEIEDEDKEEWDVTNHYLTVAIRGAMGGNPPSCKLAEGCGGTGWRVCETSEGHFCGLGEQCLGCDECGRCQQTAASGQRNKVE